MGNYFLDTQYILCAYWTLLREESCISQNYLNILQGLINEVTPQMCISELPSNIIVLEQTLVALLLLRFLQWALNPSYI